MDRPPLGPTDVTGILAHACLGPLTTGSCAASQASIPPLTFTTPVNPRLCRMLDAAFRGQ
jgi:hypothetical protein